MTSNHKKKMPTIYVVIIILLLLNIVGFSMYFFIQPQDSKQTKGTDLPTSQLDDEESKAPLEQVEKDKDKIEVEIQEPIEIQIAAAGDIMAHSTQITSAYDPDSDSYDFRPFFEDVKPIFSEADLAIANFETTTAGPEREYTGYPQFNSPDELVDGIKYAGIDVLTTVNNHSLDTGSGGLKRTVKTIQERGIDTIGTYAKKPDSRVFIKDVEGIKLAFIAYTESTNGLGAAYDPDELSAMLNMMEKDKIIADIQEAKELEPDFIISFMHWGIEYAEEPNETQIEFAELMAEEGVDLILGSHPHVIQKTDLIKTKDSEAFVAYSMGNFISNQRQETLGDDFKLTEDGIILLFDIEKDLNTNETTIKHVDYVPTWVYRHQKPSEAVHTYRILPIDDFINSDEIESQYKPRMERSKDSTVSKMVDLPFGD